MGNLSNLSTTNGRGKILDSLSRHGPASSAGELSRRLDMQQSNTARFLKQMAWVGWVSDSPSDATGNQGGGIPARAWRITRLGRDALEQLRNAENPPRPGDTQTRGE